MDAPQDCSTVVEELVAYWLRHPHASDTLEGICRWWLSDAPVPMPRVEAALAWLVERGAVTVYPSADGRVRYRLVEVAGTRPS